MALPPGVEIITESKPSNKNQPAADNQKPWLESKTVYSSDLAAETKSDNKNKLNLETYKSLPLASQQMMSGIPPEFKELYYRAVSGQDIQAAIDFRCLKCRGVWHLSPVDVKNRVVKCDMPVCENFCYRSYQEKAQEAL